MITDSLAYWFPLIKNLDISQPKTEIIPLTDDELTDLYEETVSQSLVDKVKKIIIEKFKLPVFIRTDLASAKFFWEKSCYYDGTGNLTHQLLEVISFNLIADIMGLPFRYLIVREFIPMDTRFKAYSGNMPVNPERRYFVENGKVICHHSYWIEEAIEKGTDPKILPENWREIATAMNIQTEEEIKILTGYAEQVSKVLDGFWSVDFCKAKDGRWILIDLANGELSWHQDDCPFNRTLKVDLFKNSKPLTEDDVEIV